MSYQAFVACPASGYGDGHLDPSTYAGPLLECLSGHERVTWRGPVGDLCFCCSAEGVMVGYKPKVPEPTAPQVLEQEAWMMAGGYLL